MPAIEVRPDRFLEDARRFVRTWWGDPGWVPPLLFEQLRVLNPYENPYFAVATIQPFMAFRFREQGVRTIRGPVDFDTNHDVRAPDQPLRRPAVCGKPAQCVVVSTYLRVGLNNHRMCGAAHTGSTSPTW